MKKQVYKVGKCEHKNQMSISGYANSKNVFGRVCSDCHKTLKDSPLKPKKSIKKYCGGDHCTMLWNLPCSEDHGLPKKSKKKMYKYYVLCNNCGKSNVHLIPFGTKVQDHMQKPKLWKDSCKFCGC